MYPKLVTCRIISLKSISNGTITISCKTPFSQGDDAIVVLFPLHPLRTEFLRLWHHKYLTELIDLLVPLQPVTGVVEYLIAL
jgi:hypothetical protein